MSRKSSVWDRGGKAARALERAWDELRKLHPGIPKVVMLIVDVGARWQRFGHFAPACWRFRKEAEAHEVAINPRLFHSAEDVLAVLLHESVHALLWPKHNGGCGATRYYHRKIFRTTCVDMGLPCEFLNRRYGYVHTGWVGGEVPERYWDILNALKKDLPFGVAPSVRVPEPVHREPPESGHTRLTCDCRCPRSIYVNKRVLKQGKVRCDRCGVLFRRPRRGT